MYLHGTGSYDAKAIERERMAEVRSYRMRPPQYGIESTPAFKAQMKALIAKDDLDCEHLDMVEREDLYHAPLDTNVDAPDPTSIAYILAQATKQSYPFKADSPACPDCSGRMSGAGKVWSGRNKVQRWRCNACGRTTIRRQSHV